MKRKNNFSVSEYLNCSLPSMEQIEENFENIAILEGLRERKCLIEKN